MDSKEIITSNDEYLSELHKQRVCLIGTIANVKSGYCLNGTLELDFLDVGLAEVYDNLAKACESVIVPILEAKLEAINKEYKSFVRHMK